MVFFNRIKSPASGLAQERAQLLVAARDLMYEDAKLMEDLGNNGCDYCTGGDEDVPDGHDISCPFADMVEVLFKPRGVGEEGIKADAREIRDALVMLVAADFSFMPTNMPCWYCGVDFDRAHKEDCVFDIAVETLQRIARQSFE